MNAGLLILRVASESRDAQNERDGAGLRRSVAAAAPSQQQLSRSSSSVAAAAPSQQQLRRSSSFVVAAAPSQQHYNLALKWSSHRCVPPRGAAELATPRGGTRTAAATQHQLHRSSCYAAAAIAGDSSGPATMSG